MLFVVLTTVNQSLMPRPFAMESISNLMCVVKCSSRYSRFTDTANCLVDDSECDPLLSSFIRRCDPLQGVCRMGELVEAEADDTIRIRNGSEFEDHDGCIYRVASMNSTHISAVCFYP